MKKRSVLQGVKEDYGEALPSSKMMCIHFEACEEDISTNDNKTQCGKAVGTTDNETKWQLGKSLTTSEYCMFRGTMDSLNYDC